MKTQEVFIAHPQTNEQVIALKAFMQALKIKFEVTEEDNYNPEFVAKIQKARQDYKDGKGKVYTSNQLNALWK
ncbi:MAG: hypothetical protein IPQ10_02295 [Saprospiraceae bacterium]|jgi:hypothetical protein|nr:hypothetical protein [Saprospiraceae bacterium]MBX7162188.1 hypothetical protein [Saprospiraceae bacterium]